MATILFCEDEPAIRKLIAGALRATPHRVHIAADGLDGLAFVERERPDLIFTDVSMPRLDGFQLCDQIKRQPNLAQIPIIFLSASTQRLQIEASYLHGGAGYLTKPFSPAELRATIEATLAGRTA